LGYGSGRRGFWPRRAFARRRRRIRMCGGRRGLGERFNIDCVGDLVAVSERNVDVPGARLGAEQDHFARRVAVDHHRVRIVEHLDARGRVLGDIVNRVALPRVERHRDFAMRGGHRRPPGHHQCRHSRSCKQQAARKSGTVRSARGARAFFYCFDHRPILPLTHGTSIVFELGSEANGIAPGALEAKPTLSDGEAARPRGAPADGRAPVAATAAAGRDSTAGVAASIPAVSNSAAAEPTVVLFRLDALRALRPCTKEIDSLLLPSRRISILTALGRAWRGAATRDTAGACCAISGGALVPRSKAGTLAPLVITTLVSS